MRPPLKVSAVHLLTTTSCNAWDLPSVPGSPGVCRFCYRERETVKTDDARLRRVIDAAIEWLGVERFTLTGGEPLMSEWTPRAAELAKRAGCQVHLHTNGLLFDSRYTQVAELVDLFVLAVDGDCQQYADWERGEGYFARFSANIERLIADERAVAINTFVSPHNRARLPQMADMIERYAARVELDYWLVSQYRDINRGNETKQTLYRFAKDEFVTALTAAVADRARFMLFWSPAEYVAARAAIESTRGRVLVFGQPTRAADDWYPFRVWIAADGLVTVDSGGRAERNTIVGNLVDDDPRQVVDWIRRLGSPANETLRHSLFRRPA